jgi:hypothetical protein
MTKRTAGIPNAEGRVVALGFDCVVLAGTSATGAEQLAFTASFEATENFQLQELTVLGYMGPVTIDPQGYSCSISMSGYVPNKLLLNNPQYEDGGKSTILQYVPSRQDFLTSDGIYKIPYLAFKNINSGTILAAFTGAVFESSGISANGNEYVRNNVSMRALYKNKA